MNKEDVILSIKSSLKRLFSSDMKFADYTTTDGIKIHCDADKIDVGVGVQGVDEAGMFYPLDNGTYVLNEGYTINVVDGKVESISQVAEIEDEQLESVGEEITPSTDNKVEEMGKKIQMIETQMAEVLSLVNEMVKGQEKMNNTFMSEIEQVKTQPASPSIKSDKKGFQGFSKDFTKEIRKNELEDLRKIISDKNKNNNNLAL